MGITLIIDYVDFSAKEGRLYGILASLDTTCLNMGYFLNLSVLQLTCIGIVRILWINICVFLLTYFQFYLLAYCSSPLHLLLYGCLKKLKACATLSYRKKSFLLCFSPWFILAMPPELFLPISVSIKMLHWIKGLQNFW